MDPELVNDHKTADILENREIWFRYALTNSSIVMADVIWFFQATCFPENPGVSHSGRYKRIFLKESAPNKLIWIP